MHDDPVRPPTRPASRFPTPARERSSLPGLLTVAAAGATWFAAPSAAAAQEADEGPLRVAVVDVERVAAQSAAGRALQARLQEFQQEVQRVTDSLETIARAVQQRVGAAPDTISAEERQALEREYLDALTAYQTYRQERQREGQQMQQEGFAEITAQIQPVLQALHEERDYDLVLNSRSNAVVLFSDRVDVTDDVIARLEASEGGGGGGTPDSP